MSGPGAGGDPPAADSSLPPPNSSRPPGAPRLPRVRWGFVLLVLILLGWITLNTVRTESPGSRGLEAGRSLPPFAMPLATSRCSGRCDANVATRAGQGRAGARPACEVRGPDILNSCQLAARGPLVLAFLFAPVGRCRDQVDVLERVRARFPDVAFAAVLVRSDGAGARALVSARRWRLPVGYDHDGAVANEYAVVVCPTITFARRGGEVAGSTVGTLDAAVVERWVRRIRP